MKIILAVLCGVIVSCSCLGQNNSLGQSDPEAKAILDKASAKIRGYNSIQAAFTLEIQDSQGSAQDVKKKGTIWMKGNAYKVDISGQEIYSDGKTIWTYDKSSNEVTITKYDPSSNSLASPQKLFTNFYDKAFLYKVNGDIKQGSSTVQEIEMTPTDKTRSFHKIYLYIDKKSHMVVSGKMLDKSGNKYIYSISNLKGNLPLTDANFVFDKAKHPGVEEVDLRQ